MHPVLSKSQVRNLLIRVQTCKRLSAQPKRYLADDINLPPEPTTCCMSGCANCVWIEYAETLSKLLDGNNDKAREIILSKISDPNLKMFLSLELKNIQVKNKSENDKK